jgi:D-3-phosphoglycerate dehydrogenase
MVRILVTEPLAKEGLDVLKGGAQVDLDTGLNAADLLRRVQDVDGLLVRSKTRVTAEVLAAAPRLKVVGRVGTGVDNIDLDAATRRGVVVVNAPYGNTVSVAEHTLGLLLALARHIPQADASMHMGRWEKTSFEGEQIRGKVLGLIGLGRVGAAVARRALGLEMKVIAHDAFVTPERAAQMGISWVPLGELLSSADFVSLHLPDTDQTRRMIGARELGQMKATAYLINCARGSLVDEGALVDALNGGQLAGAGLDVFSREPLPDCALLHHERVVLTPHLAGSTAEAQRDSAVEVAEQVLYVLRGGVPKYPVNAPALSPEELETVGPYLDLAQRLGKFYAQWSGNHLQSVEVACTGELAGQRLDLVVSSLLVGLLASSAEEGVNWINAQLVAKERGIAFAGRLEPGATLAGWSSWIELRVTSDGQQRSVAGAVLRGEPHIVQVSGYWLDFVARGLLLVSDHREQPGILGRMGTVLGDAGVNIHFVQVGRQERGGAGLLVMGLDDPLTPAVLEQVLALPSIRTARMVRL